jgi:hypothetical protein
MASWLEQGDPGWDSAWQPVREAVDNGDVFWITVMAQDYSFNPGRRQTATEWYDLFPHPLIPVMADPDDLMIDHTNLRGFPHVILLNPDLTVAFMPGTGQNDGYWDTLDYVVSDIL